MNEELLNDAIKVSIAMKPMSDGRQDHELLRLDAETWALVFDVAGVDYIATLSRLPMQRKRPTEQ